eukprot:281443_1
MNTKSYIIAVALIMALINLSYGSLLRRLSASSNTVTITFNNMICVEFYGTVWTYLQAYSGDYIFNGIINEAPSYIMMTCQDPSYCLMVNGILMDNQVAILHQVILFVKLQLDHQRKFNMHGGLKIQQVLQTVVWIFLFRMFVLTMVSM